MTLAQAGQTINVTWPGQGTVGTSANLTATGGASGNAVVFSLDPLTSPGVCSLSGPDNDTVSYTAPGDCYIDANQAGNTAYSAGPTASYQVPVVTGTSTTITVLTANPVVGQPITVQAHVTQSTKGNLAPTGTVTISDGTRTCTASLSGSPGVATASCSLAEPTAGKFTLTSA
jgi:hypothetical protein